MPRARKGVHTYRTFKTLNEATPRGEVQSTDAPLFLPINPRAIGAKIEMRPTEGSASRPPTICQSFVSPDNSSRTVMVAPKPMVSPESVEISTTSTSDKSLSSFAT